MQPIHELLNRIRWDPHFGNARFEIGYYDRVREAVIRVPLAQVHFPSGTHGPFELVDEDGLTHSIPLHRVRDVYRNGELIWSRQSPGGRKKPHGQDRS